jgi:Co/Zn/Cd efflux system component
MYRLEVLAAVVNGLLVFGVGAYVLFEAASRLSDPPEVLPGLTVAGIAEHASNVLKNWRELATRYDGTTLIYAAGWSLAQFMWLRA